MGRHPAFDFGRMARPGIYFKLKILGLKYPAAVISAAPRWRRVPESVGPERDDGFRDRWLRSRPEMTKKAHEMPQATQVADEYGPMLL
jgi:hypothetical protein